MIVNGKKIAEDLKNSLREEVLKLNKKPCLGIIKVGENIISEKFLSQKLQTMPPFLLLCWVVLDQ